MEEKYKYCKGCYLNLSVLCFNSHSTTKDGLRSKCIDCRRLEHIEYRKNNPEKIKRLQREIDRRKRSRSNWHVKRSNYNRSEKGKISNRKRQIRYNLNNPGKRRAVSASRRAGKRNATPKWLTKIDISSIEELHTICLLFRMYTGQEYHVDHIIPLNSDIVCGLHVPWNLTVLPAKENMVKQNKFYPELAIDYSAEYYRTSTLPVGPMSPRF